MIKLEKYNGVNVLRDDLLPGGTKSVLMPYLINDEYEEYVYASPVYGGFQIALSAYCKSIGKKATIFCAKRKEKHPNTLKCIEYGAKILEIPYGYLSVVEKHSRDYCDAFKAKKLEFGAKTEQSKIILSIRAQEVIKELGNEPDEIWCSIGSGLLVESILNATKTSKIFGVQVGQEYSYQSDRLTILKYHKPFDKKSNCFCPFISMPNYDLKAWEYLNKNDNTNKNILFWNVM